MTSWHRFVATNVTLTFLLEYGILSYFLKFIDILLCDGSVL